MPPSPRWFTPLGWLYRPVAWQGYVAVALTLAFIGNVFLAVDRHSHSVSDTLYGLFPYIVPAWLLMHWLAEHTCGRPRQRGDI